MFFEVIDNDMAEMSRAKDRESFFNKIESRENKYKENLMNYSRELYLKTAPASGTWGTVKTRSNFSKFRLDEIVKNKKPPTFVGYKEYYKYNEIMRSLKNEPNWFVSFANKYVGGGYLGSGWVQEEIITAEFQEMTRGIMEYQKKGNRYMDPNECFLWINLVRTAKHNPEKYGKKIGEPEDFIGPVFSDTTEKKPGLEYANFISVDAPKRNNRNSKYTESEISHLIRKIYTGFMSANYYGANHIHTGNLGGGVFHNQSDKVLLIQYMITWIIGIDKLYYWGVDENMEKDTNFVNAFKLVMNISRGINGMNLEEFIDLVLDEELDSDRTLTQILKENDIVKTNFPTNLPTSPVRRTNKPISPMRKIPDKKWYWLNDDKKYVEYTNDIQEELKNIKSKEDSALITVRGKEYTIRKDRQGWIQIRTENGKRFIRKVMPPSDLQ